VIWAGATWLALWTVPETYAPKILKQKAARLRKKTGDASYRSKMDEDQRSVLRVVLVSCYKPFEILLLEPMALFLDLWTALLLGILYGFFTAFPIVFSAKGFSRTLLGLSFLGILVGNILGPIVQLPFTRLYARKAKALGRKPDPEERAVFSDAATLLRRARQICAEPSLAALWRLCRFSDSHSRPIHMSTGSHPSSSRYPSRSPCS
jgi:hypothetical protein